MHAFRMHRRLAQISCLTTLGLLAAGCGLVGSDEASPSAASGDDGESSAAASGGEGEGIVRFTFAPDPVWDWMSDEGILAEMEEESGIRIVASSTWDEFGLFAGGHADIVSAASYEVPVVEEETGQETVTIGRYNRDRSVIITRADNPAETIADLQGETISSFTSVSATLVWGAYIKDLYDLDFETGGGDYEVIVADPQNQAALVADGDTAACVCLPEFAAPGLRSGELKILHDGKSSADMFEENYAEGHDGPMINVFLANAEWYESHPDEAAFFLEVWERGLQEWDENQAEIIAAYPQHFSVEAEEDVDFVQQFVADNDWFVDTVYLNQEWIDQEMELFDLMKSTGFMPEEQENPNFIVASETS